MSNKYTGKCKFLVRKKHPQFDKNYLWANVCGELPTLRFIYKNRPSKPLGRFIRTGFGK